MLSSGIIAVSSNGQRDDEQIYIAQVHLNKWSWIERKQVDVYEETDQLPMISEMHVLPS